MLWYGAQTPPRPKSSGKEVSFMAAAVEQLGLLFIFILLGFFFGRRGIVDPGHAKALSAVVVYLFLPCTIFNSFSKSFTVDNLRLYTPLFLGSLVILAVLAVVLRYVSRALTRESYRSDIYYYSMLVPNYGHMGYAMAEGLYGPEGLLYLILFSLPVSLFAYTKGYSLLTRRPLSLKRLCNPVTLSLLAGILFGLSGLKLPAFATVFLSKSAACMAPVAMLLAGITISEYPMRSFLTSPKSYVVALIRLLVIPVALALALRAVTDNTALITTAVLFYAMPCGLNAVVFPKLLGEDCSTGAGLCLLSNVLVLVCLPVCLSLI